jgi:di/tricarboxylate transporter
MNYGGCGEKRSKLKFMHYVTIFPEEERKDLEKLHSVYESRYERGTFSVRRMSCIIMMVTLSVDWDTKKKVLTIWLNDLNWQ